MICQEFYSSIGLAQPQPLERNDRVKFNRFVFENFFKPRMESCKDKNTVVELSNEDLDFLERFAEKKVKAKTKEWKGVDDKNRAKREMTGACIEYGLLKLFRNEYQFDDSIVDASDRKSTRLNSSH